MKGLLSVVITLFFVIGIAFAHEHNFDETEKLIDSGISCDELTDQQLEAIGDYYMEQMHPGESHEMMDKMMGGEGSESLKQMHIAMAKRLYCNEEGMMPMMSGDMMSSGMPVMKNMMGGGMMNMMGNNMMGSGMMGGWGYGYWGFLNLLYLLFLVGVVILVYLVIIKLWKSMQKESKK